MKKFILSVSMVLTLTVALGQTARKTALSPALQQVEQRFSATTHKQSLASDAAFMSKVKAVLVKSDVSSARLIADHCDFLLINGMDEAVRKSMGRMPAALKASTLGQRMQDSYYSQCPSPTEGHYAPDFTLATPDGKTIHFYDFIKDKKCVLLDFWASWCVWCRRENPNVRAVYDKYRDQSFTVLSVSLDEKEAAWRKALSEDQPAWSQVREPGGTKTGLYLWYGLNGIPAIFLIGPDGKILAQGLRGSKIEEAVKANL